MDSIRRMDIDGVHRTTFQTSTNVYLTSGTLSRRDFRLSYFRKRIEFCLFHRKTKFSIGIHWCVLDMHGGRNKGKFDNYFICFNLCSEDSYTKLRNPNTVYGVHTYRMLQQRAEETENYEEKQDYLYLAEVSPLKENIHFGVLFFLPLMN